LDSQALLFLVNIRMRGWTLPVIAVGLWALVGILAGAVYPAFIQKVRVEPNEAVREKTGDESSSLERAVLERDGSITLKVAKGEKA